MCMSKGLGHADDSGTAFAMEMLDGDPTAGINFDRLQKHPKEGYIIFEYLLCDERQFPRRITPYTSHPKIYWHKNSRKFLSLWEAAKKLEAKLYLINYSKIGTKYENEILVIEVLDMNEGGITEENIIKYTRQEFKKWFRKLNRECL